VDSVDYAAAEDRLRGALLDAYDCDGGMVTVIVGCTVAAVLDAFGVAPDDPGEPWPGLERGDGWGQVAILELPGAVVAVESEGAEGTRPEVLHRASRTGRAGSLYWLHAVAHNQLSFAKGGVVLYSEDAWYEPRVEGDPQLQSVVAGLDFDDNWKVSGFLAIEGFTGVRIDAAPVGPVLVHRVVPRLRDFYPDDPPDESSLGRSAFGVEGVQQLTEAVHGAPADARRRLTAWAVRVGLQDLRMEDHPDVVRTLPTLDEAGGAVLAPETEMLVRRGIDLEKRGNVLRALHHACNPDSGAAALNAMWRVGYHLWNAERARGPQRRELLSHAEMSSAAAGTAGQAFLQRALEILAGRDLS
jgi:hypothetical protein